MGMRTIKVEVRKHRDSTWTADDKGQEKRWTVQIQDQASNLTVAELQLTDAQWAGMHNGSGSGVITAEILPLHLIDKIGRIRWNCGILLDKNWDGNGYGGNARQRLENLLESGTIVSDCGAESGSTNMQRDGISLSLVGYSATGEEAVRAAKAAEHSLNVLVEAHGWARRGKAHAYPSKPEDLERWSD